VKPRALLLPGALVRALGPVAACSLAAIVLVAAARGTEASVPLVIAGFLVLAGLAASALVLSAFLSRVERDAAAILRYATEVGRGDTGTTPPPVDRADSIGALSGAVVSSFESLRSRVAELTNAR
jgi:HAMP domain-containing protein